MPQMGGMGVMNHGGFRGLPGQADPEKDAMDQQQRDPNFWTRTAQGWSAMSPVGAALGAGR